jgi:hypothetical protein
MRLYKRGMRQQASVLEEHRSTPFKVVVGSRLDCYREKKPDVLYLIGNKIVLLSLKYPNTLCFNPCNVL